MTAREYFASTYALMVRDAAQKGHTRDGLEEQLEKLATTFDMQQQRKNFRRGVRKVPESVAREQIALQQQLGGPAPLREKRVK